MVNNYEFKARKPSKDNIERIVEIGEREYLNSFLPNSIPIDVYKRTSPYKPLFSGEELLRILNEKSDFMDEQMLKSRRKFKKAEANSILYVQKQPLPRPIYVSFT